MNPAQKPCLDCAEQYPFIKNVGQAGEGGGEFYCRGETLSVAFGNGWMSLLKTEGAGSIGGALVRVLFVGANPVEPQGIDCSESRMSFFLGNDSGNWRTAVQSYQRILYNDLWSGIDLEFRMLEGELKYVFIVAPCSSAFDIRLHYEGADGIAVDGTTGELEIFTTAGVIRDHSPISYQRLPGREVDVRTRYSVDAVEDVTFSLEDYNILYELIIDPGFDFCVCIGSDGTEGTGILVDENEDIYLVGSTYWAATDFPRTPGTYYTLSSGWDIFVAKLDTEATKLLYATYIGGRGQWDNAYSFCVDDDGRLFIVGRTNSPDFPTSPDAPDRSYNGTEDGFLTVLEENATKLPFSTYIGGKAIDWINRIVMDNRGTLYITGETCSEDFPITDDAYDRTYNYVNPVYDSDAFLTKVNSSDYSIEYSTYLGASGSEIGHDLWINETGFVYIIGSTSSKDFPIGPVFLDDSINGDVGYDVFISVLDPSGGSLVYSSYFGGSKDEYGWHISLDGQGCAYITGATRSSDLPTTPGAYCNKHSGLEDGFVMKLDRSLTHLQFSTFIGGPDHDRTIDLEVDSIGFIYMTGGTRSQNFPVTKNGWQTTFGGAEDAFFLRLSPTGSTIDYSTFIGGDSGERGHGILMRSNGSVLITGKSDSEEFYPNVASRNFGPGRTGAFLAEFTILDRVENPVTVDGNGTIYAGYKAYSFGTDANPTHVGAVSTRMQLTLDPDGADVRLTWEQTGSSVTFREVRDPYDLVRLESTDKDIRQDPRNSTVHLGFLLLFNWTWPHEDPCDALVELYRPSPYGAEVYLSRDVFRVENDLALTGDIITTGEWQGAIPENGWARAGERVWVEGPKVVYEGTTNLYPPSDLCTVVLNNREGNSSSRPNERGKPISLTVAVANSTELDERLTIALADLPGMAESSNNLTFGLRVDGSQPTFANPVPEPENWYASCEVLASITAEDAETSGVDTTTLGFSISTNGGYTYSAWSRDGVGTTQSGPAVDGLVTLTLPEGDDNYVRWRARDLVGNGYAVSEPIQIRIDTINVTFSDPFPVGWQTRLTLECGVTIRDTAGSGIDMSSIQYRVSFHNLSGYSEWMQWDKLNRTDATEIETTVTIEFHETPFNYFQWRAMDIAGNGYTASPSYRVPADLTPLMFIEFSPSEDDIQNRTSVECWVTVWDPYGGSGADLSTIEYRSYLQGDDGAGWQSAEMAGIRPRCRFSIVLSLKDGRHLVELRGCDVAGNGPWTSDLYKLLVDTTGPYFVSLNPPSEEKQPGSRVECSIEMMDSLSGMDSSSVSYRFCLNGDELGDNWTRIQVVLGNDGSCAGSITLVLLFGRWNEVQFMAMDNVGNVAISEVRSIWVNSPPTARIVAIDDANDTGYLRLTANTSDDVDGDELEFAWSLDDSEVVLSNESSIQLDMGTLSPGNHSVAIAVTDDAHATGSATYYFTVNSPEPPSVVRTGGSVFPLTFIVITAVLLMVVVYIRYRNSMRA